MHTRADELQGPNEKGKACSTCGKEAAECVGHYGYIRLALPVFHIGYFRPTINMLSSVCKVSIRSCSHAARRILTQRKSCARVLLPPAERAAFLRRLRVPHLESLQRSGIMKRVLSTCKKVNNCPYCGGINGIVKKSGPMKISHEPYRASKMKDAKEEFLATFKTVIGENSKIGDHLAQAVEDLNPLKVLELFKRISAEVGW